jgi:hypothetical protein
MATMDLNISVSHRLELPSAAIELESGRKLANLKFFVSALLFYPIKQ